MRPNNERSSEMTRFKCVRCGKAVTSRSVYRTAEGTACFDCVDWSRCCREAGLNLRASEEPDGWKGHVSQAEAPSEAAGLRAQATQATRHGPANGSCTGAGSRPGRDNVNQIVSPRGMAVETPESWTSSMRPSPHCQYRTRGRIGSARPAGASSPIGPSDKRRCEDGAHSITRRRRTIPPVNTCRHRVAFLRMPQMWQVQSGPSSRSAKNSLSGMWATVTG